MRAGSRKSSTHSSVRRAAPRGTISAVRKSPTPKTAVSRGGGSQSRRSSSVSSSTLRQSRTGLPADVKSDKRRSTIRGAGGSISFRSERQRLASKSYGSPSRSDTPGLYSVGSRKRLDGSARSRHSSRAAVDVALSRLQRWGRVLILRQVLRTPGALANRIREILTMEYRLWKLRVRMAKRVLREAFNNYAISKREDPTLALQRMREDAVTVINAFLRARSDEIVIQRKRLVIFKKAAETIEKVWVKSPLYQYLKNLSLENRMQRLLFKQESIERRDIIRQRWVFLVECHQRCYNDPILLEAGIAVRSLEWWENVVMDSDKEYMYKLRASKEKNEKEEMTEELTEEERLLRRDHRESTGTFLARSSSRSYSLSGYDKARVLGDISSKKLMGQHILDDGKELNKSLSSELVHNSRFYKRADASFVFGILQEMGRLEFALSMGARPIYLGVPLEFVDSLVSSTSLARLQETKNALKLIKSRFVCFGGAFLRENLQTLPLFREVSMQLHSREMEALSTQQTMFTTSEDADAVKAFFLQPLSRKKRRVKAAGSPLDYSLSAAIMGKGWVELYRSLVQYLYPTGNKSIDTSRRITEITSSSSTSQTIIYRRNVGQFHPRCGVHMTLEELTVPVTKTNSMKDSKRSTSMTARMSSGASSVQPVKLLGSEYESTYEIERLLIRESNHRLKLKNQYKTEISALECLFQRDHIINNLNSNEKNDKKDQSEVSFVKASLLRTSTSSFAVLRSLLKS
ncbi:uncharacterized protein TM35_000023400 [Trypanosoma theileri]|uniref:Uncharacterized protein n=1 Tax=Trypanosoma theileri TaxID=67003 RepID=A0A1X0P7V9_9TRYP|nr:uncharacterized protein TM35_000023400 [Trypanosoma theileri]ORC93014.1 hypothetical protein TM35_000023400 [Trypanosoma theileri]